MPAEKCRTDFLHPCGVFAHPDQMSSGVELNVLGLRDTVHGPLHVINWRDGELHDESMAEHPNGRHLRFVQRDYRALEARRTRPEI
jgi:hypothetical protein